MKWTPGAFRDDVVELTLDDVAQLLQGKTLYGRGCSVTMVQHPSATRVVEPLPSWSANDERDLQNYASLNVESLPAGIPVVVRDAAKLARYALILRGRLQERA